MNISKFITRLIKTAIGSSVYAAIPFLGAGHISWPQGWVYAAVFVAAALVGSLIIHSANPGLLEARARGIRKDTKPFDKIFYSLFLPLILIYPLLAGADAVRFSWLSLPSATLFPGLLLFIFGSCLTTWAMITNPHAESTVRIQKDRNHIVITKGPYRIIRHPMYLGTIATLPGGALILGSGWTMLPALLVTALFVWRTAREDRTLRQELIGYEEYARMTRYRLFIGIW